MSTFLKRLRGTLGTTAAWGISWVVLGTAATMLLRVTGIVDAPPSLLESAWMGLKIGLGGCIAGGAFSAYIAHAYRERRIQDISWLKFAVGGALVTTASIAAFVNGASLLSGSGLVPWRYAYPTLGMFALFGFSAAAVSMKLAQSAPPGSTPNDDARSDEEERALLASGVGAAPVHRRTGAKVR